MYYIIESRYVGPNQDQEIDIDTIEITTIPGRTNMSHEVRTSGWLGTTNDVAAYAHGEHATEEDARAAVAEHFGERREIDDISDDDCSEGVVAQFRPGKYEPLNSDATINWCYEGMRQDISAETTDEEINGLVEQYEGFANDDGKTLDEGAARDMMIERRDELLNDAND